MDSEERRRPPNSLVLVNSLMRYHQGKYQAIGFSNFEQTTLFTIMSLYARLLYGIELVPSQKIVKMIYLLSAVEELNNRIQSMSQVEPQLMRENLPKLKRWADALNELQETIDRLS